MVETNIFQIIEENSCSNTGVIIYEEEVSSEVGTALGLNKMVLCQALFRCMAFLSISLQGLWSQS